MGYTSYIPNHFTKSGQIDRKAECIDYFEAGLNRGFYRVEKAVMKGATCYLAVTPLMEYDNGIKKPIPEENQKTYGYIMYTRVSDGWFFYRVWTEFTGGIEAECPMSVLKLLSPTDHPTALEWREQCREYNEKPKLGDLPVGTTIKAHCYGKEVFLTKKAPAGHLKTPYWSDGHYRYMKTAISDFEVVEEVCA